MASPVRIPGPESVGQVGIARDPGVRATAQQFGAGIGEAAAGLSETATAIGAHFYDKRKAVEDDVNLQNYELEYNTLAKKAYLNMQGQAGIDPENFPDQIGATIQAGFGEVNKRLASEGRGRLSSDAQGRLETLRGSIVQNYTLQGVTDAHNAKIVDLGRTVETNLTQIGTGLATSGDIAGAADQAERALGSMSQLVDPANLEKARQATNTNLGNSVISYLNTLQDEAVAAPPEEREFYVTQGQSLIDQAVSKGWIDPADGAERKREWAQNYKVRVIKSLQDDPQEVRRLLGDAAPPASGSLVDKIVGVESGGDPRAKNDRSSATGAGQFIESTWKEFIRDVHPELLVHGSDIQKLRNDPDMSRQAVQWYADKNAAKLREAGLPVTDGTLYLSHFAGDGGAKALLTADPNASAESVLGAKKVQANPHLRGMTASDVVAWADKKMGGEGVSTVSTHGGTASEPDPFFADLPADVRRDLIAGARQTESVQQNAEIASVKGSLQLGIETGEVTSPDTILNSILPDGDQAQLLRALETKTGETAQLRADTAAYVSGGPLDLNPLDTEDKKRAGALYESLIETAAPEQVPVITGDFIERTGVVPQSVAADIRRGIESDNPTEAAASLAAAANTYERAPTAVNHMDGGEDVRDAATAFTHYMDDLGYSAEDAAKKVIDLRSPERQKSEKALKESADKLVKDVTVGEVTDLFDPSVIPGLGGDPDAGFTPALEEMMLGDYREILRDKFYSSAHGDAAVAKTQAQEKMKALYGVTQTNGSPTLMKYPPEKFYPAINGSHAYVRDAAKMDAALAENAMAASEDREPAPIEDIFIEYTPETADDIRAGRLPRYRFYYATQENGQNIWQEVFQDGQRNGFGFTPEQMRGRQALAKSTDAAGQAVERDIHKSIAEDVTTQTDALRRGGLPNLVEDRERLMRERAQKERDAEYMRRGEDPNKPLIETDAPAKESPTMKFLGGITGGLREEE